MESNYDATIETIGNYNKNMYSKETLSMWLKSTKKLRSIGSTSTILRSYRITVQRTVQKIHDFSNLYYTKMISFSRFPTSAFQICEDLTTSTHIHFFEYSQRNTSPFSVFSLAKKVLIRKHFTIPIDQVCTK